MENRDFDKIALRKKREKVLELVYRICGNMNVPPPTVNFDGCPQEGSQGPELAHYHPDLHKICISERQLKLTHLGHGLDDTVAHEITHFFIHEHNDKFNTTKRFIRSTNWRPPAGVMYIKGDGSQKQISLDQQTNKEENENQKVSKLETNKTEKPRKIHKHIRKLKLKIKKQKPKSKTPIKSPASVVNKNTIKHKKTRKHDIYKQEDRPKVSNQYESINQIKGMSKVEIEEARKKLGFTDQKPELTHIKSNKKANSFGIKISSKLKKLLGLEQR